MSTGKRLAKRSILGTKVMVPGIDDRLHAGLIQAVKTCEDGNGVSNRYSVRFEDSQRVFEFSEKDIVGQGFKSVSDVQLMPGQRVYVTHNQREMQGRVARHDFDSQDVLITVNNEEETVLLKIDDVRLLESRKSARLVNSDTDFSKLADVNTTSSSSSNSSQNSILQVEKKFVRGSKAIEVPRSDYVQIANSRKRRTSENLPDDEEVLSECSAAMLLMKLSCSPHSGNINHLASSSLPIYMDLPSPASSSGASSFRSPTPSPPLSTSVTDEGIVKDLNMVKRGSKIVFQCTFPGCHAQHNSVRTIESHVRKEHLHRPEELDSDEDDEDRDHEEEFYYTEIEVQQHQTDLSDEPPSRHMASLSLVDHMDMARPAHEDPTSTSGLTSGSSFPSGSGGIFMAARKKIIRNDHASLLSRSLPNSSLTLPVSIAPSPMGSPGKLVVMSPPSRSPHSSGKSPNGKSPNRRPRDGKKCRKVYGLEQRDLWCTQCKWKKACARFGSQANTTSGGEMQPLSNLSGHLPDLPEGGSLLLQTTTSQVAGFSNTVVKEIKF